MYATQPWTIRQYAGFSTAEESNAFYRRNLAAGQKGLSVAFDLATHRGYDSDHPRVAGDVGMAGVAIDSIYDMRTLFDGIPLRPDVGVDDDERRGAAGARALHRRGRGAGGDAGAARRDHPERHPQGVHGPQHLHLPAGAVDADHLRHLRATPARRCRSSTRSRSPATTSRRPGRPPTSSWPTRWPTASSTSAPGSTPGLDIDEFAPRLSFFWAHRHELLHGGRQAARGPAAVGASWSREFDPKNPKSLSLRTHCQTSRLVADRAGRLQQRRPHLHRGDGRHPGAHPVAAHQRPRRGARAADRLLRPDRPQHPAAAAAGVAAPPGPIDPWGGSLLRRAAHPRPRRAGLGAHPARSSEPAAWPRRSSEGIPKLRIEEAAARTQARIDSGAQPVIGVNNYRLDDEDQLEVLKVDNADVCAPSRSPSSSGCAPSATTTPSRRRWTRSPRRGRAEAPARRRSTATCWRWPSTPPGPRPPSARSPTRWRRSTAATRPRSVRSPVCTATRPATADASVAGGLDADRGVRAEAEGRRPAHPGRQDGPGRPRPRPEGDRHRVRRPRLRRRRRPAVLRRPRRSPGRRSTPTCTSSACPRWPPAT